MISNIESFGMEWIAILSSYLKHGTTEKREERFKLVKQTHNTRFALLNTSILTPLENTSTYGIHLERRLLQSLRLTIPAPPKW